MEETLQEKRESADELIMEILKKMNPKKKEKALDILTGVSLAEDDDPKKTA